MSAYAKKWPNKVRSGCKFSPQKRRFSSREDADAAVAEEEGLRAYKCPGCKGWHLTSSQRIEYGPGEHRLPSNVQCPRCGYVTSNVFDCPTCKGRNNMPTGER